MANNIAWDEIEDGALILLIGGQAEARIVSALRLRRSRTAPNKYKHN